MLRLRTPLEALQNGEAKHVLEAAVEHVQFFGNSSKMRDLLLARGEAEKPIIEKRSGRSFSTVEVAARFGVTAGTVRSWVTTNRCVGYRGIGRRLRLPAWQFSGRKLIYPWVAPLIKAYDVNGWAFLHFVTVPRSNIADTPVTNESLVHRALAGDIDLVMKATRRANPD
jgi:hypothetical protein